MFQLEEDSLVWWPVKISVPVDGGKVSVHEITMQFEFISSEEYQTAARIGDLPLLELIVKGWEGILGADKKTLPFSAANLIALSRKPFVCHAIGTAYAEAERGIAAKN